MVNGTIRVQRAPCRNEAALFSGLKHPVPSSRDIPTSRRNEAALFSGLKQKLPLVFGIKKHQVGMKPRSLAD